MKSGNPKEISSRRTRAIMGAVASGACLLGLLFFFRGCSSAEQDHVKARASATSEPASPPIEIPKFGRPEEAKRYLDAMIAGDRRSLELIDRAIAEAKAQPKADPGHVAELERERSQRAARLRAHEARLREPTPAAAKRPAE